MEKTCTNCSATFECGANAPAMQCWCNQLPKIKPTDNSDCLCPACLTKKIEHLKAIGSDLVEKD
ncbi:MAG TPA: cysteine-rich CWC family protein [Chitinophagales bacterium]|nr:cysteine-rich CWC family protein [Chitinophagales bacterium]